MGCEVNKFGTKTLLNLHLKSTLHKNLELDPFARNFFTKFHLSHLKTSGGSAQMQNALHIKRFIIFIGDLICLKV